MGVLQKGIDLGRPARGDLRAALLQEVKAVCAEDGPEAVSIARIGKKLGVSSGAPYRLFPAREDIFIALIEQEMARLDRDMNTEIAHHPRDHAARLRGMCAAYLRFAREEEAMFRLSFSVSAKAMRALDLQTLGKRIYGKVLATVAACLPPDTAQTDVAARTHLLWSTIHGHALLRMTGQLDDQDMDVDDATVVAAAVTQALRA